MQKIIMAFLLCLTSTVANAQPFQTTKPVLCDESKKLISTLNEKWNEKLQWSGNDGANNSKYGLFVNEKTGTWTLLQLTPEVACIIGFGDNAKLLLGSVI